MLQLDCTLNRIDGAAKLYEHAVAGDFEDATPVPCHKRFKHLPAPRLERRQRCALVLLHPSADADHVSSQDGSQSALRALFSHAASPLSRERNTSQNSIDALSRSLFVARIRLLGACSPYSGKPALRMPSSTCSTSAGCL